MKLSFKNKGKRNTFSQRQKLEIIQHQHTCTIENIRGRPAGGMDVVQGGNLKLYQGRENMDDCQSEEIFLFLYHYPTWRIPWTEEPGGLQVHKVAKSQTQLSTHTSLI